MTVSFTNGVLEDRRLDAAIERYVSYLGDATVPKSAALLRESIGAFGDTDAKAALDLYGAEVVGRAAVKNIRERREFEQAVDVYANALAGQPLPASLEELARSHRKARRKAAPADRKALDHPYQLAMNAITAFGLDAFAQAVTLRRAGGQVVAPPRAPEVDRPIGGDLEDPAEQYRIGHALASTRSKVKAESWLRKAAKQGHHRAQYELADMLIRRKDLAAREEGVTWLFKSAQFASKQGEVDAHLLLARAYEVGVPGALEKNHRLAGLWARKAAVTSKAPVPQPDRRDPLGQYLLACRYLDGLGVERDPEKGVALLEQVVRGKSRYSRWASSKLEALDAPKPYRRRTLAHQPVTQAYLDVVRPSILGQTREKSIWRAFLDSTPLFDVIADIAETAGSPAYDGLADFLSLILDPTLSKEAKLERLEVNGERIHRGLSELLELEREDRGRFRPAFEDLFRLFAERYRSELSGEPTEVERAVTRLAGGDPKDARVVVDLLLGLGRWLDDLIQERDRPVEDVARRAIEGADRFLELERGVRVLRKVRPRSVSDLLAATLDHQQQTVAAGVVDFLSLFLDPTLRPEQRAQKLQERRTKIEHALAATTGAPEGNAFFATLFNVLGKHLERASDGAEGSLLEAISSWLPPTATRAERESVTKSLLSLGRTLDRELRDVGQDPGALPKVLDGLEGVLSVKRELSDLLGAKALSPWKLAMGAVAGGLTWEAFRVSGLQEAIREHTGVDPVLVELHRKVGLIPPSIARELDEEQVEATLSFLSVFVDPLLSRERKAEILDQTIERAASLLDFDRLPNTNWTELCGHAGKQLSAHLGDSVKPDLADFLRERMIGLGQRLDRETSITVADPIGNLVQRSVAGFLRSHKEALLDFSVADLSRSTFESLRAVSEEGRITQEDLLDRILPGLNLGLDAPLLVALDRQLPLIPTDLRQQLGDEAAEELLAVLSLPCDPFRSREERAEILDRALQRLGHALPALGERSWSALFESVRSRILDHAGERGISVHPQADEWLTKRLSELASTLDRAGSIESFLGRHREDLLDSDAAPARHHEEGLEEPDRRERAR